MLYHKNNKQLKTVNKKSNKYSKRIIILNLLANNRKQTNKNRKKCLKI